MISTCVHHTLEIVCVEIDFDHMPSALELTQTNTGFHVNISLSLHAPKLFEFDWLKSCLSLFKR